MKKTVSLFLAVVMCLSIMMVRPVFAADVTVTPDKTAYTLVEKMTITVTGVTAAMEEANAFVSVAKQKARPSDYGTWKYVEDLYETDGVWTVNAPNEAGDYEVRFYAKDGDYDSSLIVREPVKLAPVRDQ